MLKDFKQFVPSSVCLKCDGCCRFKEADSRWRPYIAENEKKEAALPSVVDKVFGSHVISSDGKIAATHCGEGFLCHFFNSKDNTCGIYHARPFECQLYPFLLGKEGAKAVLYVHLNCPFIQEQWNSQIYKEYSQYLQDYFRKKEVREFLKHNPMLLTDYSAFRPELDHVCDIVLE
ncbi:MAG: YkgJ family cysteine cluster protein [Candidatus Omnitrophica bacterium]|nr:YkgJ family cysteine cluster protein [Candidatus Omnitrophota bacterium]